MQHELQQQLQEMQKQVAQGQAAHNQTPQAALMSATLAPRGAQGANPQQMQAYIQTCNSMYMQQQRASMHLAAQAQALQHGHLQGLPTPGKVAPNLLKVALLRSLAREGGDEELEAFAKVPLKYGQGALDRIQSRSSLASVRSSLKLDPSLLRSKAVPPKEGNPGDQKQAPCL